MRIDSNLIRHRTCHFGSDKNLQLCVNKMSFISTCLLRKSVLGMGLISDSLTMQKIAQEPVVTQGWRQQIPPETAPCCCKVINDFVAARAGLGSGGHIVPSCCVLLQLV